MHFFSRRNASLALSLAAVGVLAACGDDVTVPVAPPAAVVISITPQAVTLNPGASATLSVQISGGQPTPTLASCASGASGVATATVSGSNCTVTAVGSGSTTITATTSTGQSASAAVTVNQLPSALGQLTVSPATAALTSGQTIQLVANPNAAAPAVSVAYTYVSSNTAIATVNSSGLVTAASQGVATITVTATGTGAGHAAATRTFGVTINVVSAPPAITSLSASPASLALATGGVAQVAASVQQPTGAPAAAITFGSTNGAIATVTAGANNTATITGVSAGTATITVTASAPSATGFAASSLTQLISVTVSPTAQVVINSLTQGGGTINIANVTGQFEVNLSVQPNGQNVQSVEAWVCEPGETVAACAARSVTPAAQQTFGPAGAQAGMVQVYINSAEFATPDFTTGADANTLFKNGLKTIVATATTTPAASSVIASNSLSQVNFNNADGWTINWTAPANRANDPNNITWYGGPSTPDALTPSAQSGTGSFVVVPVIYTPGRTVVQAVLNLSTACGSSITDRTRPFAGTYGTATRDTLAVNFRCTGVATTTTGAAPNVVSAVDNNNNGYMGTALAPAVATSIFASFDNIASFTAGGYRQSLSYRPNYLYLPHDYAAPTITRFNVKGGSSGDASTQDSAWVNNAYFMVGTNPVTASGSSSFRYQISDTEVGLTSANGAQHGAGAASRNTQFSVCAQSTIPATIATSAAAINCSAPVATGGITATIGSMAILESATNFTNTAYFAQVAETDRLGNRATSVVYTTTGTGSVTATPSNTASTGGAVFGVDLMPPTLVTIPNSGSGAVASNVRTDRDSIFTNDGAINAAGHTLASAALFAVRFTDNRSGFPTCVANSNCLSAAPNVRAGTFAIQRRTAPTLASVTNDAVSEGIVRTAGSSGANALRNVIDAPVSGFDAIYRDFSINIFGDPSRVASTVTLTGGAPAASVSGYYTFSGTLTDRAGNSTTIPARSVAIDNANPQITGITVPAVLAGGTTVSFAPAGTDDLEAVSADLSLRYPQLDRADGDGAAAFGEPNVLRFRRVPHYSAQSAFGLWRTPFDAVTDNKLATPIGPGTSLTSGLAVPVPFMQQIVTVDGADAPLAPAALFALFGTAADPRPNQVGARLYDIRATSPLAFAGNGRSTEETATIFAGQIPTPSASANTKNWTATGTGAVGIQTWQISTVAGVSEYRVTTSTSVTNPPFAAVYIVRQVGATEWEYIGQATYAGPLDQGGTRFWRYTLSSSAVPQGNGVTMAALSNGNQIRAIGVDASGNGLSTRTGTFGLPLALPASVTFGPFVVADQANIDGPQVIALSIGSNPNTANVVFGCSSSSALVTATMTAPTVCTIDGAGVAATATPVTITFTVTGSGAGLSSNTLTSTTNIFRLQ